MRWNAPSVWGRPGTGKPILELVARLPAEDRLQRLGELELQAGHYAKLLGDVLVELGELHLADGAR